MNTYSEDLKNLLWQRRRLEIFKRDNFTCRCCSDDKETLAVHHLKYFGRPWQAPDDCLITMCDTCHSVIEYFKRMKFNQFEINGKTLKKVIEPNTFLYFVSDYGFSAWYLSSYGTMHESIVIKSETFTAIVHRIIDCWLETGNEHLLKDPAI